jgi:isopenicillin N synthase-like dioxygenase
MRNEPLSEDVIEATEIPVLDLAAYLAGDAAAAARLAGELHDACTNVGFFYVRNHGVASELIDATFAEAARFHAQPLEKKLALRIDRDNVGYLPMAASTITSTTIATAGTPSQNEAFFVKKELEPDHADVVAGTPFKGLNRWPEDLPGFRETVLDYIDAQLALAMKLLPLYAMALDLPANYFNDHAAFADPGFRVRMSHYPAQRMRRADVFGAGAHTDYGFLTILPQSALPGLEILSSDGRWLRAPIMAGDFLINTGDMCMRVSNDRFVSTPHRVVSDPADSRYAIPFFFSPDPGVPIGVAETCTGPGNPARYEPITHGDYFRSRIAKNYDHHKEGAG